VSWFAREAGLFERHGLAADPQRFVEPRFIRELDQKGVIDQLYAEKR